MRLIAVIAGALFSMRDSFFFYLTSAVATPRSNDESSPEPAKWFHWTMFICNEESCVFYILFKVVLQHQLNKSTIFHKGQASDIAKLTAQPVGPGPGFLMWLLTAFESTLLHFIVYSRLQYGLQRSDREAGKEALPSLCLWATPELTMHK